MALTLAKTNKQVGDEVFGRTRVRIREVTFDSSYPTGGESFTPADVGLSEFLAVLVSVDSAAAGGHVVQYDYTNKKLMAFVEEAVAAGGALVEVANTTNLSNLKVRVVAIGV